MSQSTINQSNPPRIDPNAPAGPTGPSGPACPPGPTGIPARLTGAGGSGNCSSGVQGTNGSSCTPGSIILPPGASITIPYTSNGWFYNIVIEPPKKKEVKIKDGRDGCDCTKCKTFFEFAEPNQEDGTLICWACRHGY